MADYTNENIKGLGRQLLMNPSSVRRKHADRIEALLLDLNPNRVYSLEFVYYRITGFQSSDLPVETIGGAELCHDLQQMLEQVSASYPVPVEEIPETVYSVADVAARYNVSKRTVYRWRDKGLVTRKYRFQDGVERMGVREEALRRFAARNADLIDQSARFSPLSEEEERRIRARYEKVKQTKDLSPTALAEQVAREVQRAPETVRRVITQNHTEGEARNPSGRDTLSLNAKKQLYRRYRNGERAQRLAEHYNRSRSSVYRIINQERARELRHKTSQLPEDENAATRTTQGPSDMLHPEPPLSQRQLFHLYHCLKHRAQKLAEKLDPTRYVASSDLDALESRLAVIQSIRRRLLGQSLPTIFETARQHQGPEVGFADLVDEGCVCVLICVERFNSRKQAEFGRFVRLELMKNFARTVPSTNYQASSDAAEKSPTQLEQDEEKQALIFAVRRLKSFNVGDIEDERMKKVVERYNLSPTPTTELIEPLVQRLSLDQKGYDRLVQNEIRSESC